jgi:hypothetical protein
MLPLGCIDLLDTCVTHGLKRLSYLVPSLTYLERKTLYFKLRNIHVLRIDNFFALANISSYRWSACLHIAWEAMTPIVCPGSHLRQLLIRRAKLLDHMMLGHDP